MSDQKNVLGGPLECCCMDPVTGFYRDGHCHTGIEDGGAHVVCAQMTAEFLRYSKSKGNDLSAPSNGFSGLKPGDRWCLCASRWKEALRDGAAPPVYLAATHMETLEYLKLSDLRPYALDPVDGESGSESL